MPGPIEAKVVGATVAGVPAANVVAGFVLWLLERHQLLVDADGAVPTPVIGLVYLAVGYAAVFTAGWAMPHTPRPDLDPSGQHRRPDPERTPPDPDHDAYEPRRLRPVPNPGDVDGQTAA